MAKTEDKGARGGAGAKDKAKPFADEVNAILSRLEGGREQDAARDLTMAEAVGLALSFDPGMAAKLRRIVRPIVEDLACKATAVGKPDAAEIGRSLLRHIDASGAWTDRDVEILRLHVRAARRLERGGTRPRGGGTAFDAAQALAGLKMMVDKSVKRRSGGGGGGGFGGGSGGGDVGCARQGAGNA